MSVAWRLTREETVVDSGSRQFDAKPADIFKFNIRLKMPRADKRTPLVFTLTTNNGGKQVFEDRHLYWVFPKQPLRVPPGLKIAVFEGNNRVVSRALEEAGAAAVRVTDPAAIPPSDILIIGPHALDSVKGAEGVPVVGGTSEVSRAFRSLLDRGGSIIVLEQNSYDCGLLPARLVDRGATIAFQRSNVPKLFAQIVDGDFRFWRDGHMVAEKTIAKPREGHCRVLVDSGGPGGLVYLPMLEVIDGRGRFLLSQLLVGKKLDREPIARLMLENMIIHAAGRVARPEELALLQDKLPLAEVVADIGAIATDLSGKFDRTDISGFGTLLVETDCAEVVRNQAKIRAFVAGGGRMILHDPTASGLARLQKLFAEPISVQRNSSVPVTIAKWDPVIDGLSNQELYWYGSRKGLSWRVRTPLSTDVCHYVLAAGPPEPSLSTTIRAESMTATAGTPRIDKNGAYLYTEGSIAKRVVFPQSGDYSIVVRGRGTPVAGVYPRIAVLIDGQHRGSITTAGTEWDDYSLSTSVEKGEHTVTLAFVNDAYDPAKHEDRNVAIAGFTFGPTPRMKSKRLLEPAALVKVPLGKGFYLLDQIRWHDSAGAEKGHRYLANLLLNLNCPFAGSTGIVQITGEELLPDKGTKMFKSGDGIASLGTNGTVYHNVRFRKTGRYQFAVKASGTEAGGEFPNIRLSIDGEPIGDLTIRRAGWQTLRLEADVPEGLHKLGLSFTNDFYDPPADRNLKIANVRISATVRR